MNNRLAFTYPPSKEGTFPTIKIALSTEKPIEYLGKSISKIKIKSAALVVANT